MAKVAPLTGYNMKLKKKGDTVKDAKIQKTKNGRFMAKGKGSDGTTVCIAMSEARANELLDAKMASKEGKW